MISGALVWEQEPITLIQPIANYGVKLRQALVQLMEYFAARIEAAMKQGAPWTDQTGAARAGLRSFVEEAAASITLFAVTSVSYGIRLELLRGGQYAIIAPTLQRFYGAIAQALRRLVGQ